MLKWSSVTNRSHIQESTSCTVNPKSFSLAPTLTAINSGYFLMYIFLSSTATCDKTKCKTYLWTFPRDYWVNCLRVGGLSLPPLFLVEFMQNEHYKKKSACRIASHSGTRTENFTSLIREHFIEKSETCERVPSAKECYCKVHVLSGFQPVTNTVFSTNSGTDTCNIIPWDGKQNTFLYKMQWILCYRGIKVSRRTLIPYTSSSQDQVLNMRFYLNWMNMKGLTNTKDQPSELLSETLLI